MNYAVDLIIIAIILAIVVLSAKKGFISTLLDTFSMGIAAFASYKFCTPVAEWAYTSFLKDLVENRFEKALDEVSGGAAISGKIMAMIDGLPQSAVKFAEATGFRKDVFAVSFGGGSFSNEQLVDKVVNEIGYDLMIGVSKIIAFIALFIVLSVVIKVLCKFFKKVNDLPLVGTLNAGLGGILGLAKGLVIVFAVCTVFYYISATIEDLTVQEAFANSKIYSFIIENNPVIDLLK